MKFLKNVFLLAALTFILEGCQYDLSTEVFTEIEAVSEQEFSIDLNTADDPIVLTGVTNFSYSIATSGRSILSGRVLFNDEMIYNNLTPSGNFTINPQDFGSGTYTLRIEIVANAGTGSLADKLEVEQVEVWREWTVIINVTPPSPVVIQSIEAFEGQVKVEWLAPEEDNFNHYEVVIFCNDEPVACETKNNGKSTTYLDDIFIGGDISYRVDIVAPFFTVQGVKKSFTDNPEYQWSAEPLSGADIKITWSKHKYYKNLFHVAVINPGVAYSDDATIDDTEQTEHIYKAPFGRPVEITVRYQGKHLMYEELTPQFVSVGTEYMNISHIVYNKALNHYIALSHTSEEGVTDQWKQYLYILNGETKEIVSGQEISLTYDLFGSADDQFVYYAEGSVIYQLDPATLNVTHSFDHATVAELGEPIFSTRYLSVSNDGKAAFYIGSKAVVVDIYTSDVLYQYQSPISNESDLRLRISPDGQHIFMNGKILKLEDDEYLEVADYNSSLSPIYCYFHPSENQAILLTEAPAAGLYKIDLSTYEVLSQYNKTPGSIHHDQLYPSRFIARGETNQLALYYTYSSGVYYYFVLILNVDTWQEELIRIDREYPDQMVHSSNILVLSSLDTSLKLDL